MEIRTPKLVPDETPEAAPINRNPYWRPGDPFAYVIASLATTN